MGSKAPFNLSRVIPEDMAELVDLQYRCFDELTLDLIFGCKTPNGIPKLVDKYRKTMKEDPSDVWIKVMDNSTGRIIAASNWRVYTTLPPDPKHNETAPEWLEGKTLEKSREVKSTMTEVRNTHMPGPHVYLHVCFTDSKHRRRGAGGMMLRWGCDLADQLFLPAWVEALKESEFLYKCYGFREHSKFDFGGINLKREARSTMIEGGKQ